MDQESGAALSQDGYDRCRNEPIHTPPNGTNGNANYIQALGGAGATGWDWVIWAYTKAREYMPTNTKLLINEIWPSEQYIDYRHVCSNYQLVKGKKSNRWNRGTVPSLYDRECGHEHDQILPRSACGDRLTNLYFRNGFGELER